MTKYHLDEIDLAILRALSANARTPYLEIARDCKVSGASIHQRVQRLTSLGIIQGTETRIDPSSVGYETCAYIGFFLNEPTKVDSVAEQLKQIPEVVECHLTTGKYDLFIKIYAKNNEHLFHLINTKFVNFGTARTETQISFRQLFHRSLSVGTPDDD